MIVIIDYGMGNLHSVSNALDKLQIPWVISSDPDELKCADGLILPGVGAFEDSMKNLQERNLVEVIKTCVKQNKPLLGICLGMQVLFEKGYEGSECKGFGLLKGEVIKMEDPTIKIPHIGWNRLEFIKSDQCWQESDLPFVYYVHSFYVSNYDESDLVAYSNYGQMEIPGYVHKENILGMQFHPEKSGEDGLRMLKKFKEICDDYITSN